MGRDKAWLPWHGQTMVAHVVERLAETLEDIVVVAAQGQVLPELEARIIRDREPHLGPLAGLREGLAAIKHPRAFVTATDAPFLTSEFIGNLLSKEEPVAPEVDGFTQTLCAVYPAEASRVADEILSEGRRRPVELIESMDFMKMAEHELVDPESISGFNTPGAYLDAARKAEPHGQVGITLENGIAISTPIGSLQDILSAADIEAQEDQITFKQGIAFHGLTAPVGPGEELQITASPKR